jgi:cell division protein FtsB
MSDRRTKRALGRVDGPRGQRDGAAERKRQAKRPRRRLVFAFGISVLLVGVLFVAVFPTRTYLAQRTATRRADARLAELAAEKKTLQAQARRLSTPAEIESLARAQFGLVRPGEEAYAVLPPPTPPLGLPDIWPFTGLQQRLTSR